MLSFLNFIRTGELTLLSIVIRLVLAVICGGCIGLERERKHRPAGFRTHILICLGASMTTLTSNYLITQQLTTDPARLGAQVIAGIGFIGAGTIIITKHRQVKGLTTAAGLWAAAIVGLCCGAGFVEGAVFATIMILLAELVFARLEYLIVSHARAFNMYVEYTESTTLGTVIDCIKNNNSFIVDMEITKSSGERRHPCAVFSIRTPRKVSHQSLMTVISKLEGVVSVEEL